LKALSVWMIARAKWVSTPLAAEISSTMASISGLRMTLAISVFVMASFTMPTLTFCSRRPRPCM